MKDYENDFEEVDDFDSSKYEPKDGEFDFFNSIGVIGFAILVIWWVSYELIKFFS